MESDVIQKRLAENLRRIRKGKMMTQFDLAVKCDISEAMVKNIELNRSWPSEKTLSQITKALNIDIYQLFLPLSPDVKQHREISNTIQREIAKSLHDYIDEQLKFIHFQ